jgi:hypothetical protein
MVSRLIENSAPPTVAGEKSIGAAKVARTASQTWSFYTGGSASGRLYNVSSVGIDVELEEDTDTTATLDQG